MLGDPLQRELAVRLADLRKRPADREANRDVAVLLCVLGRHSDALPHVRVWAGAQTPGEGPSNVTSISDENAPQLLRSSLQQLLNQDRHRGDALVALTALLMHLGERESAASYAKQALMEPIQPMWQGLMHGIFAVHSISLGDDEIALTHLQEAVKLWPERASAHHNLAVLLSRRGETQRAFQEYEKVTQLMPEAPEVWIDLGRTACLMGDYLTARQALEKALSLGAEGDVFQCELADVLYRLQDYKSAIRRARVALESVSWDEQRVCLTRLLGESLLRERDWHAAQICLQQVIEREPHNASAHYSLGAAFQEQMKFGDALTHFELAAKLDPDDPSYWYAVGFHRAHAGDLAAARPVLERALALGRRTIATRNELVGVLIQLRDLDAALRQGREAVESDPENAEAHFNLSLIHRELDDLDQALHHAGLAAELGPHPKVVRWLGQLYVDLGRHADAERVLSDLLGTTEHESAHALLVQSECEQNEIEKALGRARTEVATRPNSAVAWAALSVGLRAAGDIPEADQALEKAESLDPEDPWVIWAREDQLPDGPEEPSQGGAPPGG